MKPFLVIGLLCLTVITTGCWDRTEINDLAFVMGTALDLTENGEIEGSVQIALPSGQGIMKTGGAPIEKFFVISAVGKSNSEVINKLQRKLSRRLFAAHRSVIFISERLAKRGIKDAIDIFTHDPRNRLRTYIMLVKGRDAKELLKKRYPFEEAPTEAVKEMEISGRNLSVTLRDFFITTSSEGIDPIMGVIRSEKSSEGSAENKNQVFKTAGSAVFKNLKLIGLLNDKETDMLFWLTDRMKFGQITADLPKGYGNVGMNIINAKGKITPVIHGDKVAIHIQLEGKGSLFENNTPLDVGKVKNLKIVQKALEKSVKQQVEGLLSKTQNQYKADVAGFGREIYRTHPKQWKSLKKQWDQKFPQVEMTVKVKLTIRETGVTGTPMQLKEEEIKQ